MSAAAAPTIHRPTGAARPPHLWSRHGVIWGVVLLAFGFVLGLTVTALGAASTGELGLDRTIAADRFPALVDLAKFVNVALGPGLAATILAVVCVALWALQSLRTAVVFGALTSIGWLSSLVGKVVIARPRPPQSIHPLVVETARDSFPSGHTSFAAAFVAATVACLWLAGRRVRAAAWIGAAVVVVVALTRLVLGAHFLADVVAAPLFAFGAVALVTGLWRTGELPWLSRIARVDHR